MSARCRVVAGDKSPRAADHGQMQLAPGAALGGRPGIASLAARFDLDRQPGAVDQDLHRCRGGDHGQLQTQDGPRPDTSLSAGSRPPSLNSPRSIDIFTDFPRLIPMGVVVVVVTSDPEFAWLSCHLPSSTDGGGDQNSSLTADRGASVDQVKRDGRRAGWMPKGDRLDRRM